MLTFLLSTILVKCFISAGYINEAHISIPPKTVLKGWWKNSVNELRPACWPSCVPLKLIAFSLVVLSSSSIRLGLIDGISALFSSSWQEFSETSSLHSSVNVE